MNRRALATGILVAWGLLVAWHVRREYFEPELTRLAAATLTLAPGTHFYSLRMGSQAIGLSSSRLDTVPEGFLLEDQMNLELQALGQSGGIVARSRVILSRTLTMQEFSFSLDSDAGSFAASGEVEGTPSSTSGSMAGEARNGSTSEFRKHLSSHRPFRSASRRGGSSGKGGRSAFPSLILLPSPSGPWTSRCSKRWS